MEHPLPAPSLKAVVEDQRRARDFRRMPLATPSHKHVLNATQHPPVVNARNAIQGRKERAEKLGFHRRQQNGITFGKVRSIIFVKIDWIVHRVVNGTDNATVHVTDTCLASMKRLSKAMDHIMQSPHRGTLWQNAARKAIPQKYQKAIEQAHFSNSGELSMLLPTI